MLLHTGSITYDYSSPCVYMAFFCGYSLPIACKWRCYIICCPSTATTIIPLNDHLYIATKSGSVYEMVKSDSSCKHLAGAHQSDTTVCLFALKGRINTKGFLSNIGIADDDDVEERLLHHIPCNILLGMGAGYEDLFHRDKQSSNPCLYFTTWVFPFFWFFILYINYVCCVCKILF